MISVWNDSQNFKERQALNGDIKTNTLIIGAGIAGILIAYFLNKEGNTRNTTAKITSQHHIIYSKIKKEFGIDMAKEYALANETAIKKYKEIINERNIDCDFEEKSAYVYSLDETKEIIKEVEVAKEIGIDAEFVTETNLPFKVKGGIL
ncbi:MAG: hypothetical protein K5986_12120 [Clostridium sp.]|nr:hypothetical protein [Clostridium sp.]